MKTKLMLLISATSLVTSGLLADQTPVNNNNNNISTTAPANPNDKIADRDANTTQVSGADTTAPAQPNTTYDKASDRDAHQNQINNNLNQTATGSGLNSKAADRDANPSQLNNTDTAVSNDRASDRDARQTQINNQQNQTATGATVGQISDTRVTDNQTPRDRDTATRDRAEMGMGMHQLGDLKKANQIIGMEVKGTDNERLGKVKDLALDLQNGRIVEVIVAKGGVLGVDEKYVAVPPGAFTCDSTMKSLRLTVDKDQFKNSPEFQWSHWKDSMGDASVREVYQRYGVQTYYGTSNNVNGTAVSANGTTNYVSSSQVPATADASNANAKDQRGQALRYYSFTGTNGASSNYVYNTTSTPQTLGSVTRASKVIGSTAYNNQNEKLGKVHNLIVDLPAGRVVEVVLASGGTLGIHDDLSAIPPQAFAWNTDKDALTIDTTREALKSSPHFRANDWNNVNDPSHISEVYTTYHVQPYFTGTGVDNTAQNVRDRSNNTLTPLNQGNSKSDRQTSAKIRQALVADKNLSVNAKNVKIITKDGQVTLRGVVNSDSEKSMIAQEAVSVAGADKVDNQLQVRAANATDRTAPATTPTTDTDNK